MGFHWTFMEISWDFMGVHWGFMGFSWDCEFWNRAIKASSAVTKGYITKNDWISLIKQCPDRPTLSILRQVSAQFLAYIPISVRDIRYRLQIHASYIYIYIMYIKYIYIGPATYFPNDYHSSFVMMMMMMTTTIIVCLYHL